MDDLIDLLEAPSKELTAIKQYCLNEELLKRPTFSEIVPLLTDIKS
jgi:hypothetical protein